MNCFDIILSYIVYTLLFIYFNMAKACESLQQKMNRIGIVLAFTLVNNMITDHGNVWTSVSAHVTNY